MTFRKTLPVFLALSMACLASAARPAAAQVPNVESFLKLVPADAWGFALIPNFDKLDSAVNRIQSETVGMPMFAARESLAMIGLGEGLNTAGAHGLVVLDHKKFGGDDGEGAFVLIVSATNADAMLKEFSPEPEVDGLIPCTIDFEPWYARKSGDFLIVAKNKDAAKAMMNPSETMDKVTSSDRKEIMGRRVLTVSAAVKPILAAYSSELTGALKAEEGMSDAEIKPVRMAIDLYRGVNWADAALGFDDSGLTLNVLLDAAADSDMGKMISGAKGAASLLSGLPGGDYLATFAFSNYQVESTEGMIQEVFQSVISNAPIEKEEDKKSFRAAMDGMFDIIKSIERTGMCVSALKSGDGMIGAAAVIHTKESGKTVESVRSVVGIALEAMKRHDEEGKMGGIVVHTADAETIDSVKVDHILIDPTKAPDGMDEEELAQARSVLGQDAFLLRFGAIDGKSIIVTFGGGKDFFTKAIAAARSSDASLSRDAGIVKVTQDVPANRVGEFYLNAENICNLIRTAAKSMGEDEPFPFVPKMSTPVAFVQSTKGSAVRMDFIVPMDVIHGVRDLVMSQMGGMGGGAMQENPYGEDAPSHEMGEGHDHEHEEVEEEPNNE
jgi:hypothetical protein